MTAEHERLRSDPRAWKRWGPYLAERAWGTVREDYSASGDAWNHLPHEHARFKAYRWNEDGLGGICDHAQRLCFALALWNGQDAILKERLFGLGGTEGNHGEDVKEHYFYLDCTPTHSYMRMLYKYPQRAFPYQQLVRENAARNRDMREFELADTGAFDESRYWDVFIEYAKASPEDMLIKISAHNRGPQSAMLTLMPTLWFRNTWSWEHGAPRPALRESRVLRDEGSFVHAIGAEHNTLGDYELFCKGADELLFTENETNVAVCEGRFS
jgi:hypothetical protein